MNTSGSTREARWHGRALAGPFTYNNDNSHFLLSNGDDKPTSNYFLIGYLYSNTLLYDCTITITNAITRL